MDEHSIKIHIMSKNQSAFPPEKTKDKNEKDQKGFRNST